MELKRIHRGIRFHTEPWMKSYIEKNTSLRMKAKNAFEKDFFKLMNNSVFGKTLENIRKRSNIRLLNSEEKARKMVCRPNFRHLNIFSENLAAVHLQKTKLVFDKPVYVGASILDLSKTLMYKFHYLYAKEKWKDLKLTQIIFSIKSEQKTFSRISQKMWKQRITEAIIRQIILLGITMYNRSNVITMYNRSDYPNIVKFAGLRPKLYSLKMEGKDLKKWKGVTKSVVKKELMHEDYENCLFSREEVLKKMNVIRSREHEVFSETVEKVALSAEDDKRWILEDGISTLALGHWRIPSLRFPLKIQQ